MAGTALKVGAATAAAGALGLNATQAQVATPVASEPTTFLFIQTAGATTLTPVDGAMHTLTMTGISTQTLYFSNRPAQITGTEPTASFTELWPYIFESSPPNATLIAHPTAGDDVDVAIVVALSDPVYDKTAGTLTYQAEILDAERIAGRTFEQPPVTAIDGPQEFAEAHLFIDDAKLDCGLCVVMAVYSFGLVGYYCKYQCAE